MSFDSTDDYVNVGDTSLTDIRVLSFWAKPNDTTEEFIELSATDSVEVVDGVVTVTGFGTKTIYVDEVATTSFPDTNWHHIVVVSDTDIITNTVEIGRVGATYYTGLIDSVKIYNYALISLQVHAEYNNGAVNFR
jgi:hypothetical protein